MNWKYKGKEYNTTPEDYHGFVYIITELDTGKMYVGKKFFWKPKTLPITKTRKRRVKTRAESDWRTYWGSSDHLNADVLELGEDQFTREILHYCPSRGVASYLEAKEQFERGVLLKEEYYNEFIGCKIHSKHIRGLQ